MNKLWRKISFYGLEHLSRHDAIFNYRRNILINRISSLISCILIVYLPIEILFYGTKLIGLIAIQGVLMLGPLLLHKKRWYTFSRHYFLGMCLFMVGSMILITPKGAGHEYFMIPTSMIGVLFLRRKWHPLGFMISTLIFFYIFNGLRDVVDPMVEASPEQLKFFGNIFIAMVFFMSFIIVMYFRINNKSYERIINKQKSELEHSNKLISEKSQEITDSITYAKRIQAAILPCPDMIKEALKNAFILYKPKDIVAGDFYWMQCVKEKVIFAAADCTGHGVPGAMVSVICNNALNRSVREYGLTEPGKLLDRTRKIVISEFNDVKDGMDIALCSLEGNKLQYAGAYNPLWIVRNGEIIETKPDKQPVGRFRESKPYTTHTFELEKGDTIYIFSDGYVDQFGGPKEKKFRAKSFRELLLNNQHKSMEEQHDVLDKTFEDWKGDLEQIDDVCVIGLRYQ